MASCKINTQVIPACFAWGLFLIFTALFFIFPCRHLMMKDGERGLAITVYEIVLSALVFCHFLSATIIDPGKYPKAHEHETEKNDPRMTLHRNIDINGVPFRMKWCTTCQFYRPPRCSHCSVCDMCIDTFDHHCPWVNNCIGRRNYRYFVLFLLSLWIHMVSVLAFSILVIVDWRNRGWSLAQAIPSISIVICCAVALLLIPVTGLSSFHVYLISSGRTTNEQVTGKIKANFNPFSRGCSYNWLSVFWSSQFPLLLRKGDQDQFGPVQFTKSSATDEDNVLLTMESGLADDSRSVASSVVVSQYLRANASSRNNGSTVNLIRGETTPSINDYYIEDRSNHVRTEDVVVNGHQETGMSDSSEEDGPSSFTVPLVGKTSKLTDL